MSISRSLAKCRVTSESSIVGGITLYLDKTNQEVISGYEFANRSANNSVITYSRYP